MKLRMAALLFLAINACIAQEGSDTAKTGTLSNGRTWLSLSDKATSSEKLNFLTGAAEAAAVTSPTEYPKYFGNALTIGEFITGIDRFYDEPANLPIPIIHALRLVTMKANGENPAAVERTTASIRRQMLEAQQKQM